MPDAVTMNAAWFPSVVAAGATDTIAVPGSVMLTVAGVGSTSTGPVAVEARSSATAIVSRGSDSLSANVVIVILACDAPAPRVVVPLGRV